MTYLTDGTYEVTLKHCDRNGHNLGLVGMKLDARDVDNISITLDESTSGNITRAKKTYKSIIWRDTTLRATFIDAWLRQHSSPGREFTASLVVSNNGSNHHYSLSHL